MKNQEQENLKLLVLFIAMMLILPFPYFITEQGCIPPNMRAYSDEEIKSLPFVMDARDCDPHPSKRIAGFASILAPDIEVRICHIYCMTEYGKPWAHLLFDMLIAFSISYAIVFGYTNKRPSKQEARKQSR